MDVLLLSTFSNLTPISSEEKDWPLTLLEGRKEGTLIQREAKKQGQSRSKALSTIKTTRVAAAAGRTQSFLRVSNIYLTVSLIHQMILKRQLSFPRDGWVTFHVALWGGDDEEFRQQSPSQLQQSPPPGSQPHQRATPPKARRALRSTVALLPARLWFLYGCTFPLLLRLTFLPAERRGSKNPAGHQAVPR